MLPIIGTRIVSEAESRLEHVGFVLPKEDMWAWDALSARERSWTYNLLHADDSRVRSWQAVACWTRLIAITLRRSCLRNRAKALHETVQPALKAD